MLGIWQRCGLRPSVLGQDRSDTKKIGLGLGLKNLVLFTSLEFGAIVQSRFRGNALSRVPV